MTAEQLEELLVKITKGGVDGFYAKDRIRDNAISLAERVLAAEKLAKLVEQGECPWREDTRNYREWWAERKEAAVAYREASK